MFVPLNQSKDSSKSLAKVAILKKVYKKLFKVEMKYIILAVECGPASTGPQPERRDSFQKMFVPTFS